MLPYEIWLARFTWRGCKDPRPWLVIDQRGDKFGCFPFASETYHSKCFDVDMEHPDFVHTGLTKNCHIHDEQLHELPTSCFMKQRGVLRDSLLDEFLHYAGL